MQIIGISKLEKILRFIRKARYRLQKRTPWYPGYNEYKSEFIEKALGDEALLDRFGKGELLPQGYGIGLDERVVEYPWLLSRLSCGNHRVLDAGAALNHPWILSRPGLRKATVFIYTLSPENFSASSPSVSYIYGDLRSNVLKDELVDTCVCLSTLEHIGMDNTVFYTSNADFNESSTQDYVQVVREIQRVTRKGGKIYITVPFGKYQNHGWFQQFTEPMLLRIFDCFCESICNVTFYSYSLNGWQISEMDQCVELEYFDYHRSGLIRTSDLAAAARAVACIEISK